MKRHPALRLPVASFLVFILSLISLVAQTAAPPPSAALSSDPMEQATRRIIEASSLSPEWSFTLEPYLWAIGISGHIGIEGFGPARINFSSPTVLQHLDWGFMARGEVRRGRWALLGDGLFAQLSARGEPPGPLYENASVKIQQGMASLALSYRLFEARQGFLEVYAGARFNSMSINLGGSPDSAGIQMVSDAVVQRVSTAIGQRVDSFLTANAAAIESAIVDRVTTVLTERALLAAADFRDSLSPADKARIIREIRRNREAFRELVVATAQARIALARARIDNAREQLPPALRRRLTNAQKRLARALAQKIEERLPTSYDGDQWWVDPIVGLRGQVNFTRWLFLAAQGDVGGFGAGSDIAWMAQATIGINFTRHIFGEVGYRFYYLDYAHEGAVINTGEYGVFSGLGVKF